MVRATGSGPIFIEGAIMDIGDIFSAVTGPLTGLKIDVYTCCIAMVGVLVVAVGAGILGDADRRS